MKRNFREQPCCLNCAHFIDTSEFSLLPFHCGHEPFTQHDVDRVVSPERICDDYEPQVIEE